MASLVQEFHANLPFQDGTRVFMRGLWVPFDGATINKAFELQDNEAYRNLWNSPNYDEMLELFIDNSMRCKTNSKNKVLNFPRTGPSPTSRIWHYFISSRLKPSSHISLVSKERAILNIAIAKGMKFDVGHVIESSII